MEIEKNNNSSITPIILLDEKKNGKEQIDNISIDTEENIEINPVDFDTIVLSGGSIKGIVTLGALQYAKENYLLENIKTYIGTSSGAIISYLLAIGYNPIEMIVYWYD